MGKYEEMREVFWVLFYVGVIHSALSGIFIVRVQGTHVWGFCTCSANGAFVFRSLSETVVGNLSFLTPVLCKLQEVGKAEEKEDKGDRRSKGISFSH